jgi:dienelactone hydrolase
MTAGRRAFLMALTGAAPALTAEPAVCDEVRQPSGWCRARCEGRTVFYRGEGPVLVLLHEINGLSPGCVDFGVQLADSGFRVFMPLLFGHAVQDNVVLGYLESCWGEFSCEATGKDMKIAGWLRRFVAGLKTGVPEGKGIGVIGMCLTGGLPLNVMTKDSGVKAVVMSQPAIPFGGLDKQDSIGVSDHTMLTARESGIPILAFRFKDDTISTAARFRFLDQYFGMQFEGHQLDTPHGFHADWTHSLHAVLTGAFGEKKQWARRQVIAFMRAKL